MTSSVFETWWPVTYDYGLIRSDLTTVQRIYRKLYSDAGIEPEVVELRGPLEKCFRALEPLEIPPTRELFVATDFGWTAYFRNSYRGSDPFMPMVALARQLKTTAMRVCISPEKATYPAVIWEVYEPPEAGGGASGHRRTICAANDGGRWVFSQSGEPFFFEQTKAYSERLKRDRFTSGLILSYLKEFGIPEPSDAHFERDGAASGCLFSRESTTTCKSYTLEDIRTGSFI